MANRSKKAQKQPQEQELVLRDTDVICGRGTGTSCFIGNVEFRFICYKVKELYTKAHRQEKRDIAQKIMDQIAAQDPPGRFVELIEGTLVEDRRCILAPFEQALEKTCQALREKKNGCPRQYRQFESKKRPMNARVPPDTLPRISEKDLSMIKKNIEEVTGKSAGSPSPHKLKSSPEGVAEEVTHIARKTSRQIMMEQNNAKREEEAKRAYDEDEETQRGSDSEEKAKRAPRVEEKAKRAPPAMEEKPKPAAPHKKRVAPSPSSERFTKKTKLTEFKPATPKMNASKLIASPTKQFEKPVITLSSSDESDEESLPENSFQARIFASSIGQGKDVTGSRQIVSDSTASVGQSGWKTGQLTSFNLFEGKVDDFFVQHLHATERSVPKSQTRIELDADGNPKYPFVSYPYCFLQSLASLDDVPAPEKLTADDILASFSLAREASEERK
ncbi:hypothetical protein MPSEU_000637900 [Mayamaea pseudoterrestris]|nr:hypothetical protein MPSEU_000637900 [Mayamaea pseudoterrestris]